MQSFDSLLQELTSVSSVSGDEIESSKKVLELFAKEAYEAYIHSSNSVVALLKSNIANQKVQPKKLMIAAHLDEIGFVISKIEENGICRFNSIGYDAKILIGAKVALQKDRSIVGVIYSSGELGIENKIFATDLYIDFALLKKELAKSVSVGDLAYIDVESKKLQNSFFSSPFLDNRCSVAALFVAMQKAKKLLRPFDTYFVATSGEEFSGIGAATVAASLNPDLAIAVDVTFANQLGNLPPFNFKASEEITLSVGPLYDKFLNEQILKIASEQNIKVAKAADASGSGTDAFTIRSCCCGIPVALLSPPLKNMHTPAEIVSTVDLENLSSLLANICCKLEWRQEDV